MLQIKRYSIKHILKILNFNIYTTGIVLNYLNYDKLILRINKLKGTMLYLVESLYLSI